MNITFLIGNGFDLGLGLRSRFSDFYNEYCNSESENPNILKFKDSIRQNIENWSDFEKAFGVHSENFEPEQAMDYYYQFNDFQEKFNTYLQKELNQIDYSNKDLITKTMQNALNNFYHTSPVDKIHATRLFEKHIQEAINYNFISFNYTNCLDNCIRILQNSRVLPSGNRVNEPIHVHGYLDENMIMGLDNELQITNRSLEFPFPYEQCLVKPDINNYRGTAYDLKAKQLIKDSTVICIYGMSLGETDTTWWKRIIQWLGAHKDHHLYIIHHCHEVDKRFPQIWIAESEHVRDKLLSFQVDEVPMDTLIYTNVHIGINYPIFAMNLVN